VCDVILPKLQKKKKLIPLPFHNIISIRKTIKFCTSTCRPSPLVRILFRITILPPYSDSLLKTQAVYSSETLLHRPHIILTKTTLHFFTTVKTGSKKLRNIIDNSEDDLCWEN
jgi:hypothetical protein